MSTGIRIDGKHRDTRIEDLSEYSFENIVERYNILDETDSNGIMYSRSIGKLINSLVAKCIIKNFSQADIQYNLLRNKIMALLNLDVSELDILFGELYVKMAKNKGSNFWQNYTNPKQIADMIKISFRNLCQAKQTEIKKSGIEIIFFTSILINNTKNGNSIFK